MFVHVSEPSAIDSHFSLPIVVVPDVMLVEAPECCTLLHVAVILATGEIVDTPIAV